MRSTFEIPSMKAVESAVWNNAMNNHVYKSIELTGSSSIGIEDAVTSAVAKAHETVRNIQWVEIIETRGHVVDGKVAHWQVSLKIGFTLD